MRAALCLALLAAAAGAGCRARSQRGPGTLRLGYVLHVLNDFTDAIQRGAEDAAADSGVAIEVQGPANASPLDAIAMFEGMVQRQHQGLVVVPMPGDVWKGPLTRASRLGVPVVTANITASASGGARPLWFGQDETASGVLLAGALMRSLAAAGLGQGAIIVGSCAPAVDVLQRRYVGFKRGMQGTQFQISEAFDVTVPNPTNYASWENLIGAHPDAVAFVGLCSMDPPHLGRLKSRRGGRWLAAGYDLSPGSLAAVRAGNVAVLIGQHPYLQGYLPVLALAEHLRSGHALPRGWVDVGTEVVTRANVDDVWQRETDASTGRRMYAELIRRRFGNLIAMAKPLPR